MTDEVIQEIEDLRLNRDQFRAAPQFAPARVERVAFETKPQFLLPRAFASTINPYEHRQNAKSRLP